MKLKLVTMLGVQIDEDIYEVMLPTSTGEIAIYPGHEPLVTVIAPGAVVIRRNKGDANSQLDHFAISGGVAEIDQDGVRVLVDRAIKGEDISEDESRAALERALMLRDEAASQIELDQAHELVDRHTVRLKVAELRRHHRGKI